MLYLHLDNFVRGQPLAQLYDLHALITPLLRRLSDRIVFPDFHEEVLGQPLEKHLLKLEGRHPRSYAGHSQLTVLRAHLAISRKVRH